MEQMDAPTPVGNARKVRSRREHRCEACGGVILPGFFHMMQSYVDCEGLFMSPARNHVPGECRPFLEDEYVKWDKVG